MRRAAPRPLSAAVTEAVGTAAPADLLTRVQGLWAEVAGPLVAEESTPVAERAGTVTVACRSAVWSQELELLSGDILGRLNDRLGDTGKVAKLRFRTASAGRP